MRTYQPYMQKRQIHWVFMGQGSGTSPERLTTYSTPVVPNNTIHLQSTTPRPHTLQNADNLDTPNYPKLGQERPLTQLEATGWGLNPLFSALYVRSTAARTP